MTGFPLLRPAPDSSGCLPSAVAPGEWPESSVHCGAAGSRSSPPRSAKPIGKSYPRTPAGLPGCPRQRRWRSAGRFPTKSPLSQSPACTCRPHSRSSLLHDNRRPVRGDLIHCLPLPRVKFTGIKTHAQHRVGTEGPGMFSQVQHRIIPRLGDHIDKARLPASENRPDTAQKVAYKVAGADAGAIHRADHPHYPVAGAVIDGQNKDIAGFGHLIRPAWRSSPPSIGRGRRRHRW
ncbi:hypothetical protein AFERRI_30468 [Acidithiobacillus ferrivorans]|uniref:Uncharacterized protein n=1 Tax=Acidithiobacillus ferrivorans TaxID=160808 RepID=A0A060UME6_9PROT|nr:hypothetical protein AFERRI_30468 [Acidithiobacillus ferrivorans]